MNKIEVSYQPEIITKNKTVQSQDANSISFELLGDIEATIKGDIPLPSDKIREFNNYPGQVVNDSFPIRFEGAGDVQKVLVVRTYYKEV